MNKQNLILPKPNITSVTVWLLSIVKNDDEYWIQTKLLDSDNRQLSMAISNSLNMVDTYPYLYIHAENKLLRRWYSMYYDNKVYHLQFFLKNYALKFKPNVELEQPSSIIGYPNIDDLKVTCLPSKKEGKYVVKL